MDKRQGGRPRDPDKDDAVRETVRRMLAADGYQRTTIPAVARAAGIGAPTIYRRWPTQAAMVESAIADRPWPEELAAPSEFRYYLPVLVRAVVGYFADPATRAAMPGLLVEYYREPSQYAVLVERTEMPLREAFRRAHAGPSGPANAPTSRARTHSSTPSWAWPSITACCVVQRTMHSSNRSWTW
ncbi:Putative transcriptional regulator%2C TetR family [Mycobacteroides abscessus]|nr:Putative transcriptional regulator%2C TetR family [Mycobacteroides abscessus]